jgi:phosphatidate cytidylyltransferase
MLLRIITALILIPLVLAGIFYLPALWFTAIVALILLLAAYEMSDLFWPKQVIKKLFFLSLLIIAFIISKFVSPLAILIPAAMFWIFLVPYLLVQYSKTDRNYCTSDWAKYVLGLIIFLPTLIGFLILKQNFGSFFVLIALLLVWAADIGAYFIGIKFGKNRLAPKISPKKSIEGLFGGLVSSFLVAIVFGIFQYHFSFYAWAIWLLFIAVVVLWSVLGDLFESMLKRVADVKDSGRILPGHGGIYDRIDSLTAAVPLFVLGLLLLKL